MDLSFKEIEKILQLLDSQDDSNFELGLAILKGFYLSETNSKVLFDFYLKIQEKENSNDSRRQLNAILIGTAESLPTRASRLLTLLFEQGEVGFKNDLFKYFKMDDFTLELPRVEFLFFPKELLQLADLQRLIWKNGNLRTLPEDLFLMENLEFLDLRYQPLEEIPASIGRLKKLHTLWIRNALIVSEEVAALPNLDIFIEGAY